MEKPTSDVQFDFGGGGVGVCPILFWARERFRAPPGSCSWDVGNISDGRVVAMTYLL